MPCNHYFAILEKPLTGNIVISNDTAIIVNSLLVPYEVSIQTKLLYYQIHGNIFENNFKMCMEVEISSDNMLHSWYFLCQIIVNLFHHS